MLARRELLLGAAGLTFAPPLVAPPLPASASANWLKAHSYDVLLVADDDSRFKDKKGKPLSSLARYALTHSAPSGTYKLRQGPDADGQPQQAVQITSRFTAGGRGTELSELLLVPGTQQLLAFDDRTGIVFDVQSCVLPGPQLSQLCSWAPWVTSPQDLLVSGVDADRINQDGLVPRWIVATSGGNQARGFKTEWLFKSSSQAWSSVCCQREGVDLRWIKTLDPTTGTIQHIDWSDVYAAIKQALGVPEDGYVIHEACVWSEVHNRWFFLPRKVSNIPWSEETDPFLGGQVLVSCADGGQDVQVVQISGAHDGSRGFSAMRFLPGTADSHIVALKTVELSDDEPFSTYMTVINLDGKVLMPDTLVSQGSKYEGLEVLTACSDPGRRLA